MPWISVKDRLPSPGTRVLVNCTRDLKGMFFECDQAGFTFSVLVAGHESGKLPSYVTHWMFLPEPPRV